MREEGTGRWTRRQALQQAVGWSALALTPGLQAEAEEGQAKAPPFDPTAQYQEKKVEGWRLLVNTTLIKEQPALYAEVMTLMGHQLYQIPRVIPEAALESLRKITLWVELNEPHHPCMVYHPDPGWLRDHGMNPEKAGCVEMSNSRNFLSWTLQQPWMTLHELTHSYHDKVLGFENKEVNAAYEAAVASKAYEAVLRISGQTEKHYALTNSREYFAELTESYFGTNDFYPFVRPELKQHDPGGYAMIQKAWGVDKPGKKA